MASRIDEGANAKVQSVLDDLVERRAEVGAQVAAYVDGDLVVDACAGLADEATKKPVDGQTLFTSFSTTKGVTTTCIHMLAERSLLDYDTPIAEYWPEFAANGKARATIRDALTHRIGVPQMPANATAEMMCDWEAMCRGIADLTPLWEPGTKTGYHALTFGWIVGEIVRRVDGRPIAEFVQEEISAPLGINGLFLGIPEEAEKRVATLKDAPVAPGTIPRPENPMMRLAVPPAVLTNGTVFNRADVRRASIPAAGGIMNARSIARLYAALACGGSLDEITLISPVRLAIATELQTADPDEVIPLPFRKALGYFLGGPASPMFHPTAFGHPGAGGSIGFAYPERRFSFGYTKNLLQAGPLSPTEAPAFAVAQAVRPALGIY
jgi:CubicO group peptidase (beta-lactamase class C family)